MARHTAPLSDGRVIAVDVGVEDAPFGTITSSGQRVYARRVTDIVFETLSPGGLVEAIDYAEAKRLFDAERFPIGDGVTLTLDAFLIQVYGPRALIAAQMCRPPTPTEVPSYDGRDNPPHARHRALPRGHDA